MANGGYEERYWRCLCYRMYFSRYGQSRPWRVALFLSVAPARDQSLFDREAGHFHPGVDAELVEGVAEMLGDSSGTDEEFFGGFGKCPPAGGLAQ